MGNHKKPEHAMNHLPPLRLTGGQVLRDGALQARSIALAEGKITDMALPEVDLSGFLILPGIVDLHGDGFEHHMAPRPSAPFPMGSGFASFDREAAAHGVTTAYMAQSWSWEGAHRAPDHAEALLAALEVYRPRALPDRPRALTDRGKLTPGMRADLVVVNEGTRAIEATITAGRLSHLSGEAGRRFMAQPQMERVAAE